MSEPVPVTFYDIVAMIRDVNWPPAPDPTPWTWFVSIGCYLMVAGFTGWVVWQIYKGDRNANRDNHL